MESTRLYATLIVLDINGIVSTVRYALPRIQHMH